MPEIDVNRYWKEIRLRAEEMGARELAMKALLEDAILERNSFAECLTYRLTRKLINHGASVEALHTVFLEAFDAEPIILQQIAQDMDAVQERDPACPDLLTPLIYFKGFQSLVCYRVGHYLWKQGRREIALYLQSLIAETFSVDIHPAARIGSGILLDHATGFVAGETTIIDDDVSILHEVTLGGTGKERGNRHPKVRSGVLLGAGAKILGNVEIGVGAKVGAGSVVLHDVAPYTSVAGVPAKPVGKTHKAAPALDMEHGIEE
jgi:serine O-acetyltransferase